MLVDSGSLPPFYIYVYNKRIRNLQLHDAIHKREDKNYNGNEQHSKQQEECKFAGLAQGRHLVIKYFVSSFVFKTFKTTRTFVYAAIC